ncbi:hypothetical protein Tco_0612160, partial [Tanacetum coccineum]
SKRSGDELEQKKAKKQKGNDDQDEVEMKRHIEMSKMMSKHNTTRTNIVLPAGITFDLPALTITLSLPVGTTYLPAGTFTLPVGTTYLLVVTIYYNIPNNFAVQHIMRTQALEAGARIDTLEDTGSSS